MRPSCRRYLCFLLAVCFIINEQESEGTAPCIIFREREKHASMGRASCNRKHCKLKGKDPVRGSDKYQYSLVFHVIKKHFPSVHSRQMFTGAALSASSLHSHAGLLSSCASTEVCDDAHRYVVAVFRTINLLVNRSPSQDVCVCVCAHLKWKFGI